MALMVNTDVTLASRLQILQKELPPLQPHGVTKLPVANGATGEAMSGEMHLESIVDTEPSNTRASFVIFLDGAVRMNMASISI